MNKKIYLTLILGIFLLSFTSALSELPPVKQGECIELFQYCPTCTYVNWTGMLYPDNTMNLSVNEPMTKTNTNYNYTFCDTTQLGEYHYFVTGDKNSQVQQEEILFHVTPSGKSGTENIIFFIVVLGLLYFLTIYFFSQREIDTAPFVVLSGMALGFLGVYMITNGIIIFRDTLTNYISYVTIGIGFGLGLFSLVEWLREVL